jgi:hypothetical protein
MRWCDGQLVGAELLSEVFAKHGRPAEARAAKAQRPSV